ADVGAITRLEAFLDSLKNAPPRPPLDRPVRRREVHTGGRTIYIPPMTDHSQALAAALQANGVEAYVLPESDARTRELGLKYTSGKECYPCALTTGDMLKPLLQAGTDPDRVAFFMPGGTGPCRFGQYHRLHRQILDELGFEDVPIYSPHQSEVFYEELGLMGGDFTRRGWQGLVAVDLLLKALLQTRPYETMPGAADRAYRHFLAKLCRQMAEGKSADQVMAQAVEAFRAIPVEAPGSRPLVGVVGEIYTRANRFANEEVVRTVEELGGEAWMPPIAEWVLYINFTASQRAKVFHNWRALFKTRLEDFFQHKDIHHLAKPWRGRLQRLDDPRTSAIMELAGPYLHPTYEGEAILSLGKAEDMLRRGAVGIINVFPFTCMPGNIVNALMKRFREAHGGLPFLPLAMDGQEQGGNRIRLEAFMHQVTEFRRARSA
ncbi:MAG: CoA activase, partial [Deltaproteobacteria bacterium]|nr:CoA activase [Deltaproteobacteria bacterium]